MVNDDQRDRALVELWHRQKQAESGLVAVACAGERPSDELYERYLAAAREFLSGTLSYERHWPGSFPVQNAALPLIQQLLIYSDHLLSAGNHRYADRCRAEADDLTARHLDEVAAAGIRRGRAGDEAVAGRFHSALALLYQVQATFETAGQALAVAQTALELANILEWLGDLDRALKVLGSVHDRMAQALHSGPPTPAQVAAAVGRQIHAIGTGQPSSEGTDAAALQQIAFGILTAEGRIDRLRGDYDEAECVLRGARPYSQWFGVPSAIDYHLAAIACARGDLGTAETTLTRIEPDFDRPEFRPRRPALRLVQADVLLARNRPGDALGRLDDGTVDLHAHPDLDLAWKLQWRRGTALRKLNRPGDALVAYDLAISAADELRKAPLGYRLDTTYLRDKLPMFHDAIDHATACGDALAAVRFIELIKARALSAVLSVPRTARDGGDEQLFDDISARLDSLEFATYAGRADTASLRRRADLLAQRDALLERIRIHDPRWRTMSQAPPAVDIESVTARLATRRAAALSLFHRPGRVVACVLDRHGAAVAVRTLDPDAEQQVEAFALNLRAADPDPYLFDLSGETLLSFTDLVPRHLAERIASASALIIVPHGVLHLLPWATMLFGDRRLFQYTTVGMLPNLACLPFLDDQPVTDPAALLIGDPSYAGLHRYHDLPCAGPKLGDITALYGPRLLAPPSTQSDATDAAFWSLATHPGALHAVLHVACHGRLEATEPMASGLLLTGSTVDAAQLVTHRITTPEVVLSACSTGWRPQAAHGSALTGDDALGLTASFLEAGARFVLASVPPVDDEAARAFTVSWHRHRHSGAPPLDAFRAAQLDMFDTAPERVRLWAGFTAYGCR